MSPRIKKPFVYNGVIYLSFFGCVAVYTFVELLLCSLGYKDISRRHYTRKVRFHIIMLLYALFECSYSISFILHNDDLHDSKWGFVFHTFAAYLHVVLFGLTVNFWKQSLQDISASRKFGMIVLGVNGIVTLLTVFGVISK